MKYKIKDKRNHKAKIKNKMFNNKNRNNFKSQLFYLFNDFISIFIIYIILFIIN
jgi:hypothetical protein